MIFIKLFIVLIMMIFQPMYWLMISSLLLFSPMISIIINKCINESYWLTGSFNIITVFGLSVYVLHYICLRLNVYLKNTYIYKLTNNGYNMLYNINDQIYNKLLNYVKSMVFKSLYLINTKPELTNVIFKPNCIKRSEIEYDIELLNLLENKLKTFNNIINLLNNNTIIISDETMNDQINNINNSKQEVTKYLHKLLKNSKKNNVKKTHKLDKSQFNDMLNMIKKQE